MRILLVRHAEPDYARDSLTPRALEAELLSRRLCRLDVKAFYVSPLGRAQDTAAYTLSKVNRTAETLPWLAEFRGRCYDAGRPEKAVFPGTIVPGSGPPARSCSIPVRGWKARCWLRVTSSKSGRKLLPAWTPCWPGTATTGMAPFTAVPTTVPIRWCSFATLALPPRCSATCAAFHPFPCGRASACFLLP